MFSYKVNFGVLVLLALGAVSSGLGILAHRGNAEQPPRKPTPEPTAPPPRLKGQEGKPTPIDLGKEPDIKPRPARTPKERTALLKAQVIAARKAYQGEWGGLSQTRRFTDALHGTAQPEKIYTWSIRWLQAERSLNPKHEDQVVALEAHFKRMSELQRVVKQISKDLMPRYKEDEVEWYRLEAELWLGEAKAAK